MLIPTTYAALRDRIRPLDVVAFGGRGIVSDVIKRVTGSVVSHIGLATRSRLDLDGDEADAGDGGRYVQIIESTSLDGCTGVVQTRASMRIASYNGEAWILPLAEWVRRRLDVAKATDWLLAQRGVKYDAPGAILAGLGSVGVPVYRERLAHLFCSEAAVAALEIGGGINAVIASGMTPDGVVTMPIFAPDYYQVRGTPLEIEGFGVGATRGRVHVNTG